MPFAYYAHTLRPKPDLFSMPSYAYGGGILTSQPLQYNQERRQPITKPVIVTGGSGKLGKSPFDALSRAYHEG